jgi:hypothetical protein
MPYNWRFVNSKTSLLTKSQLVYAKLTDPAKSMAWCCLSYHAATILQEIDMDLVDAALKDVMTSQRTEVKQSAASFLYNLSIGAVIVSIPACLSSC